jgi:K(+)-stimulated pyrophosphate-energized sodium pump
VQFVLNGNEATIEGTKQVVITSATMKDFSAFYDLSLFNPLLLSGIFLGAMMSFVFCAMTMKAVGRAAGCHGR